MSKLIKKTTSFRKLLRKIFMFAGAGAVSLVFQACYGPEMDDSVYITGIVRCKETNNPIPGINVSIQNNQSYWERTELNGTFNFYLLREEAGKIKLEFEDVDEHYNGGWFETKIKEIEIPEDTFYHSVDVYLDKKSINEEGE